MNRLLSSDGKEGWTAQEGYHTYSKEERASFRNALARQVAAGGSGAVRPIYGPGPPLTHSTNYESNYVLVGYEYIPAQQGWFDDPQGRMLGMHWLEGSGQDLTLNDQAWGDYMRANQHLNNIIMEIIDNDVATRKQSGGFSRTIFAETGFNNRRTGYGLLHGTQNFNILMDVTVINSTQLFYSATLTWNDRINPNATQGDSPWVTAAGLLYTPQDYDVRVVWMQNFNVTRK